MEIKPVLKWVGGKRQLLPELTKRMPTTYKTYCEAFIGGGALLFAIQPKTAIINDFNSELINVYQTIKKHPQALINYLKKTENTSEFFYDLRSADRDGRIDKMSDVERAGRILYLNKTCYNGLYRVNRSGQANSPFGSYKNPLLCPEDTIRAISKYFNDNDVQILNGDFADATTTLTEGDFCYFDPPYDPVSETASYTGYTSNGFDIASQIRLKELCDDLNNRGVRFMLSNSATDFIKDLYADYYIDIVGAKRAINSKGNKRGEVNEVIVRNYE